MSEEAPKKPINYGDAVVIQEPKKAEEKKRTGCAPGFIILLLVIGLILISLGPGGSSPSPPASFPTATLAPGQPTPTTAPASAATVFECQPGIAVGKTVNVVYDQVRMRRSAGYVNKNDATDSIHYMRTGDKVQIKGGPERKDGLCWWLIEHAGHEGWTADHSREGKLLLSASP